MLLITFVFIMILSGCSAEPSAPPVYTIYYKTFNFSPSDSNFGYLEDKYYRRIYLTSFGFDWEKTNNFQEYTPVEWTNEQIYSYLIGLGFGSDEASYETAWLTEVSHGMLGVRDQTRLYIILK